MSTFTLKTPDQKRSDQADPDISDSCIAEFNKLSQQRQIKILKQSGVNVRSFTQYVFAEKRSLFSDIKQLVDDSKRENEIRESNAKQIERKYGENIRELYVDKVSIKIIADCLVKFEQIENADSKLKISESVVRNVVRCMELQRADDRKKGKKKLNRKVGKRSTKKKSDTEQIEIADGKQIEKQIDENAMSNVEQIEIADGRQIQKQIDPEIENVLLDDLGDGSELCDQTECR